MKNQTLLIVARYALYGSGDKVLTAGHISSQGRSRLSRTTLALKALHDEQQELIKKCMTDYDNEKGIKDPQDRTQEQVKELNDIINHCIEEFGADEYQGNKIHPLSESDYDKFMSANDWLPIAVYPEFEQVLSEGWKDEETAEPTETPAEA